MDFSKEKLGYGQTTVATDQDSIEMIEEKTLADRIFFIKE